MPVSWSADDILEILDKCCESFTFPVLDNGYVYLAATRMSLHRSEGDWALVIEVFGFSPRAGLPDTNIYTFASTLHARRSPSDFVSTEAYERYLANNPHNESRFVQPIEEGDWLDPEAPELISARQHDVTVRGRIRRMPTVAECKASGVVLSEPPRITVFELCRALASVARDDVLATSAERCGNLAPGMRQILQLEEWHHPDVVNDECRPRNSETFQQLAQVLATGRIDLYQPSQAPNTHWRYWPDGGSL